MFQSNAGGAYTLAFRGTAGIKDDLIDTDFGDIVLDGLAVDQIIDMYNYYQKLTHTGAYEGVMLQKVTYEAELGKSPADYAEENGFLYLKGLPGEGLKTGDVYKIVPTSFTDGLGIISTTTPLHLTGHSLGGHLAAAFSRLFPSVTIDATMINGAGFSTGDPLLANNFNVTNLFSMLDGASDFPPGKVANYIGSGLTLVAQDASIGLKQPGEIITVEIESHVSGVLGHGSKQMTDSLAVMGMLWQLDSTLSITQLNQLLLEVSGDASRALEATVNTVAKVFGYSTISDESDNLGDGREEFYVVLNQIQNRLDLIGVTSPFSIALLGEHTGADIAGLAGVSGTSTPENLAVRFALTELSAFAIVGYNYDSNALSLYDPETGQGTLTKEWITDRSNMLSWLIEKWTISGDQQVTDFSSKDGFDYRDFASGQEVLVLPDPFFSFQPIVHRVYFGGNTTDTLEGQIGNDRFYGMGGNDTLKGEGGNDYLEGGSGNDSLLGGGDKDTLLGMSGSDTLAGGQGNDILNGGQGNDRYEFKSGDGFDRILDNGGQESIYINGQPSPAGKKLAPNSNVWLSENGLVVYTLINTGSGRQDLWITYGADDRILIEGYRSGAFGLTLSDYQQTSPVVVPVDPPLPIDEDGSEPGVQYGLHGSGSSADNRLDGGQDEDYIQAGYGKDTVVGGAGSDRLLGQEDDDQLFAEQPLALSLAAQPSDSTVGGVRGDWLDGGSGDDTLVGALNDDALHGGEGQDLLIGGDGNDNLTGDGVTYQVASDWQDVRDEQVLGGNVVGYQSYFRNAEVGPASVGGDDVLLGGAGNDWLVGDGGNDLLDGGTGFDVAFGETGNDTLLGGSDNDVLSGDNLDWEDGLLSALHGHDLLDGGAGHDSLTGNGGNDILLGGEGNDFIKGDDSSLEGLLGDAYRYHGNDYLQGDSGNDTLSGGGGADSLYGGVDDDLLIGDYADLLNDYQGADLLDGGSGKDTLQGMGGADSLIGGTEDDQLEGDAFDLESSKHGDDLLQGDEGNDSLWGGGGADRLYGGADNDYLEGDYASQPESYHGSDHLDGGLGSDTLVGDGGNDTLLGGSGEDYLVGGSGHNLLDGGSDNDALEAGTGNDRYVFASGYGVDTIRDEGGQNVVQFGVGFSQDALRADVIQVDSGETVLRLFNGTGDALLIFDYQGWSQSNFSFADGGSLTFAELMQRVTTPIDATGTEWADALYGSNLNDSLYGSAGDDSLWGGDGNDYLYGGDGNDSLDGGAGDDYLLAACGDYWSDGRDSGGNDTLRGGDGNDKFDIQNYGGRAATILIDGGAGDDLVALVTRSSASGNLSLSVTGGAGVDTYAISGIHDWYYGNVLVGNYWVTDFTAGAGGDRLDVSELLYFSVQRYEGYEGGNPMAAELGYLRLLQSGADTLLQYDQDGAAGMDYDWQTAITLQNVLASSLTAANFVDAIPPDGSDVPGLQLTGTAGSDELEGRFFCDTILGGAGSDWISGNDGADYLDGGDEADDGGAGDWIEGGSGSDTILGGAGRDTLYGGDGSNILDGGSGNDCLYSQSYQGDSDILDGGAGDDHLYSGGGAGNDTLRGGDGNDVFHVSSHVNTAETLLIDGGAGDDLIRTAISGNGYRSLSVTGGAGIDTYAFVQFGYYIGSSDHYAATDFVAGAGGDRLDVSVLLESFRNWGYTVGNPMAAEMGYLRLLQSGTDTLLQYDLDGAARTGSTWQTAITLQNVNADTINGNNFTPVTLEGTAGVDSLIGGLGVDTLNGAAGNDLLDGDWGDDAMSGGAGNDIYYVDSQGDLVKEIAGEGTDKVVASSDYVLAENVENLDLGAGASKGTGNALNNLINGNSANNTLNGGSGADTLYGGTGDDVYVVDNLGDSTIESAGDGLDRVNSSISWTLDDNVEVLSLLGTAAINATGNAENNRLYGNGASNVLSGGAGDDLLNGRGGTDTLIGGIGNDSYVVDDASDVIIESADEGADNVNAALSYRLTANLEKLTLTGGAAINATGNELANTLKGNGAANALSGGLGNDNLYGGLGNDSYLFARGDGKDKISENDATVGNQDKLIFSNVTHDQLWFRAVGNNLEVSVIGTGDKVSIIDWSLGTQHHVEQILASDGLALNDTQVSNLVNAMAAFAPPAAGQTNLPSNYHAALDTVIAANWQ